MEVIKCVIVGDSQTGKTCLLISSTLGDAVNVTDRKGPSMPDEYIPTVFDNYMTNLAVDDQLVHIGLWDTAGSAAYDRLRPLSYPRTDVVIVCFSLIDPVSLENVRTKWVPEVRRYLPPNVPIVLVGTKMDLCEDETTIEQLQAQDKSPISHVQGVELAMEIGAADYLECSVEYEDKSLSKAVFDAVVRSVLYKNEYNNGHCPVVDTSL